MISRPSLVLIGMSYMGIACIGPSPAAHSLGALGLALAFGIGAVPMALKIAK